ncbi:MFS transporter [Streptomyces sp. NBC_01716]|uniref:MFS transporter n=1 Tax=Streptomyces sp. NBC_01716 TaxID=2975917 RepID=UPI002E300756|nr:MFS transporter [Streptomyces sp. NBC_01716]
MSERAAVSVVLSAGVAAAVSLGKFSPFLDQVRDGFHLSLTGAGWLTSSVTVVAAVAATTVGRWAGAGRSRSALALGLVTIGLSGLGTSVFANAAWQLFLARLLEAVGYVAIMVAGPALLAQVLDVALRKWALALWGMCIPAGLAAAAAGGLMTGVGWRGWLVVPAVASLLLAAAVYRGAPLRAAVPGVDPVSGGADFEEGAAESESTARLGAPVWLLASGFALVSMVGLAVVTLLPAFLTSEQNLPRGRAGALTSVVAAASIVGSVVAGLLAQRGVRAQPLFVSALLMPFLGAGVFLGPTWLACFVAAGLLMIVNGIVVAAVFSALPSVAGISGAGMAAGMVTQIGSLGTLLGPPLFGAAKDLVGWWATLPLMTVAVVPGLVALLLAVRRSMAATAES